MCDKLLILTTVVALGSATIAHADHHQVAGVGSGLSAHGGVYLPIGDYGDAVGLGFSAALRYSLEMNEMTVITGSAGLIYHLPKDLGGADFNVTEFPIMAGIKYRVGGGPYAAGELGVNWIRAGFSGVPDSSNDLEVGMFLGGGYDRGPLDFRGGLMISDFSEGGDAMGFMLTVGYQFLTL